MVAFLYFAAGALTALFGLAAAQSNITLEITTKSGTRNKTAPYLHGLFFEDINVSLSSVPLSTGAD
jgi:hypothetical protein